jgi:hypothetical protein
LASAVTGGNAGQGAVISAFGYLFNEASHEAEKSLVETYNEKLLQQQKQACVLECHGVTMDPGRRPMERHQEDFLDALTLGIPMAGAGSVRLAHRFFSAGRGAGGADDALLTVLGKATPTGGHPNQLMTVLDDGTRVLFRKDFGAQAHRLGGSFQGKGKVNHYNIQLQTKSGGHIENIHIVPTGKGRYTWWGKDGVIKK